MRIAISTDGDFVSPHFGRCPSFTIVDIDEGKLVKKDIVTNPGHQPSFLPQFLREKGVNAIVAGGMGQRAIGLFSEQGIEMVVGISGSVDEIINKILNGTLEGGESLCQPGSGRGYGLDKTECDHEE